MRIDSESPVFTLRLPLFHTRPARHFYFIHKFSLSLCTRLFYKIEVAAYYMMYHGRQTIHYAQPVRDYDMLAIDREKHGHFIREKRLRLLVMV